MSFRESQFQNYWDSVTPKVFNAHYTTFPNKAFMSSSSPDAVGPHTHHLALFYFSAYGLKFQLPAHKYLCFLWLQSLFSMCTTGPKCQRIGAYSRSSQIMTDGSQCISCPSSSPLGRWLCSNVLYCFQGSTLDKTPDGHHRNWLNNMLLFLT